MGTQNSAGVKLNIQRSGGLARAISLDLALNDNIIKSFNLDAGSEVKHSLPKMAPGLHRLGFIWKTANSGEPYSAFLRFYVIP